jgi:hypothetical protein
MLVTSFKKLFELVSKGLLRNSIEFSSRFLNVFIILTRLYFEGSFCSRVEKKNSLVRDQGPEISSLPV